MVVRSKAIDRAPVDPNALDIAYLGFFLGLRVNALVLHQGIAQGFGQMRESHGYVVQHLIESERSITELARRMNVTQQAASKQIAELVRHGLVESSPADDKRARRIRLSAHGWNAVRVSRRARRTIDARLRRAVGPSKYDAARSVLVACLDALGGLAQVRARRIREPR